MRYIPVIVFVVTFVTTLVLTVVVSRVYDARQPPGGAGSRALPPFPTVAPLVEAPAVDPLQDVCVSLVGDARGQYVPAPLSKLRPCVRDGDCEECVISPDVAAPRLSCELPSELVADQQADLDNPGPKFCLPTPTTCVSPGRLTACTHNADCAGCSDELGDGEAMTCEIVTEPKSLLLGDDTRVNVGVGSWCLPKTGRCDPSTADLHWTTDGWACTCRFPTIHGGEACDVLTACNNHLTTGWSAGNQQLLVNRPGPGLPEVWSPGSGINPTLCHTEGEADTSRWDRTCGPGTVPNTVCQCDGLMRGSRMGFRNDPTNPLTCVPDSCSVNALGGHATEPLELVEWSGGAPVNQCVCSGAGARVWDVDARDPEVVAETDPELAETLRLQQGHVYTGRCSDTTIATAGARVVLRADPTHAASDECAGEPNTRADITSLVPGFAVDSTGTASVSVCAADPCRGQYSDPAFRPPEDVQSQGHFSAELGRCECVSPARQVQVPDTEATVNPVGSVCVNACAGMDSSDPEDWPCKRDPYRPCPQKPECLTGANGEAVCVCAAGCGNTDGYTCTEKFEDKQSCSGYVGVPGVCPTVDGKMGRCMCHNGRSRGHSLDDCDATENWYAMCTTSLSDDPSCHQGAVPAFTSRCGGLGASCDGEPGCDRTPS